MAEFDEIEGILDKKFRDMHQNPQSEYYSQDSASKLYDPNQTNEHPENNYKENQKYFSHLKQQIENNCSKLIEIIGQNEEL